MAKPVCGTISVDFAGSREEAREFVKAHSREFPHGLTTGRGRGETTPNGDAMLFSRFSGLPQKIRVREAFEKLGWDRGSQS